MVDKLLNLFGGNNAPNSPTNGSPTGGPVVELFEPIEDTPEYQSFRARIALKKLVLDEDCNKTWSIYECGPREIRCPVIFLPPVSGTADIFFRQLIYLSDRGYRVISAEYPTYFTLEEFCSGFLRLLRYFRVKQVHLFGASLGGFLAQKFAQFNPLVVASMFICNSFCDTSRFKYVNTVPLAWFAPASLLRSYFVSNQVPDDADTYIRAAAQFMSSKLSTLSQQELLSRLSLNLTNDYVRPERLQSLPITIMDVFDHSANSNATRQELYKMYPNARRAHLKTGGNFPYLSRSDEVNMHLLVHLRQFNHTERACCIHYADIKEEEDEPHCSSLESSVELARVAEEVQEKALKNKPEKIEESPTENNVSTVEEKNKETPEAVNISIDSTEDKENSYSQVDHLV